ncbi:MAG: exodeoxyribonuclease III [Gammaproteobacteria bacterium]|nr:exodeoxyribonuclease III [Gammaproteobacteria bacterium]
MRVISFNANGIRSAIRKGFYDWLAEQNADFVCIQETKMKTSEEKDISSVIPEGYYAEFEDAEKRGYSGVAIFSRQKPLHIQRQLGHVHSDTEGRFIQFDYEHFSLVSVYMPSGTSGPERQNVKMNFLKRFQDFLEEKKRENRRMIICGDWNIAHQKIDLKNWKSNQKNSGFLPEERAWLDTVFYDIGYVDAFRVLNQSEEQYSWWSARGAARSKNVGWRIDYHVISPELKSHIERVEIVPTPFFSDHAPVIIDYIGLNHA